MSLFDVIRYPISNPPTKEELGVLPRELYMAWIMNSDWGRFLSGEFDTCGIGNVSRWYREQFNNPMLFLERDKNDILLLRQMIKDYDEPV